MYLKTLKIVGFKSFADRTRLEFRPGVTVIVGPNGSGKSNIVDAIAWVMGTQSPKALRTERMDEVIFAGTATRPPLGRAEVTLVFDNSSGMLPLDLPEVSITRRLYRDGSSDYEINGVACRLLDIQELLSDSGVGRHQHVVVGQGQIDSVLSGTPDEHRAVIEEAAGILKHRIRKEKAIRRLERTGADVVRLHDILGELSRRMRPLKRQAAAAERYRELVAEVRALRLFVAGEELRRIRSRTTEIDDIRSGLSRRVAEGEAELTELAGVVAMLRREAARTAEEVDRHGSVAARLETTVERLRRMAAVAHERKRLAQATIEGFEERRRDLEEELGELRHALADVVGEEETARREAEAAERRFRGLEDEERSLADQEAVGVEGAVAVVRGDLQALRAAETRDARELASVEKRLERLTTQREAETAEVERLEAEITDIDSRVGEAQSRYESALRQRRAAQEEWENAEADHAEARVSVAGARAKLEAIELAVAGVADPEARRRAEESRGARGSTAACLDVPASLAAAVDAALGPWADAVCFDEERRVVEAAAALKADGMGGVPLVASGKPAADAPARRVASRWGYEALVDKLGPDADLGLAAALLGDVVLVEGWRAGWELVSRHPDVRAVTPEGDLISTVGIRVAQPDGATPAMLELAQADVERAEIALARASSLLTQARRRFDDIRAEERKALEELEMLEARLAGVAEAAARLRRAVEACDAEIVGLEDRRRALEEQRRQRAGRIAELERRLAELAGEQGRRQEAWQELQQRRRKVAVEKEEARAEWQERTATLRASAERRRLIERRLAEVTEALTTERDLDPGEVTRLDRVEDVARRSLGVLEIKLEQVRSLQAAARQTATALGERLGRCQRLHEEVGRRVAEAKEHLNALAVEQAELRVRAEAVAEALRRDVDADEEEALAAPRPDVRDPAAALASAEAELRRMGPVNPLAAAEYAELEERHRFLTDQLGDLERSRQELRKVIEALDREIEARFTAAFSEVSDAYQEHFRILFPGGRGRLRLTDPDEPLTSGVEIEAQPLGKRVSKMSLLSGGERSLAALAFLFAVFRARPSPFYVLDEVEAALDDANLRRFLRLLERFRDDAQLLIVTHQQLTMEAADVLYGVTMEPGGSTKVVSKRLGDVAVG